MVGINEIVISSDGDAVLFGVAAIEDLVLVGGKLLGEVLTFVLKVECLWHLAHDKLHWTVHKPRLVLGKFVQDILILPAEDLQGLFDVDFILTDC